MNEPLFIVGNSANIQESRLVDMNCSRRGTFFKGQDVYNMLIYRELEEVQYSSLGYVLCSELIEC